MKLDHITTPSNKLLQPMKRLTLSHLNLIPLSRVQMTQRHVLIQQVILPVFRKTGMNLLILNAYQTALRSFDKLLQPP
jgi:hypothetical protein